MADLVELLLGKPGLYVGPQADPEDSSGNPPSVARISVTPLPGRSGVMFEYDVLSPGNGRVHHEHAVLARTTTGLTLVTSHSHADTTAVLTESEPGYFLAAGGVSPFPMAIRLEVPEPGHLIYSWSYGGGTEPLRVRDVGDVRIVE
jgi:hypothetical protein